MDPSAQMPRLVFTRGLYCVVGGGELSSSAGWAGSTA
jgi:hypothetical protein